MPSAITPTRLNQRIKEIVDSVTKSKKFNIIGEVSNMKTHSSGNLYFTIKDANAQVTCIMFSNYAKSINFRPSDGIQVMMNVSVFFNIKNGQYSLNVYEISEVGVGDLSRQFNLLKEKLEREGLFSSKYKKEIPKFPKTIAIITSPTGAAVLDIISTINRRYPIAKIIVLSTLVQGNEAKNSIVENIKYVNDHNLADVIICGRGGGSIEDLWAFNEEIVARAIFNSIIPIISSVGHEPDFTIADFVADVRAATPTAAAEIATCDIKKLESDINNYDVYMQKMLKDKINDSKNKLKLLSENQYFLNPFFAKRVAFDCLDASFNERLINMNGNIRLYNQYIKVNLQNMENEIKRKLIHENNKINVLHAKIDTLNPLATLSRGYSITTYNNKSITSCKDVRKDMLLNTKLNDGIIISKVVEMEFDGQNV